MDLLLDRLTLQVPGRSEAEGHRLAKLVAQDVAAAEIPADARSAATLEVSLVARPGEGVESMARRIAKQIVHALEGSSW